MTILALAQTCAKRLQLTSPASFVGSTDNNMILLKVMIEQAMSEIGSDFPWPELEKEYTFTLATSTASYALPGDLDRFQFETLWNRTQTWPLIGPLNATEWQQYKSGAIASFPRQRFRIKGWATNQFFIDPTPSSSENGQTVAFEYISATTIRPITWVTGLVAAATTYCSYNGNIYYTSAGGTAGATPPTHTTGSASDGTVTWVYQTAAFTTITLDTDEILLDNQLIIDGAIWRFKRERGLDYEDQKREALDAINMSKTRLTGAGVISWSRGHAVPPMLGVWSYPTGSFGL